jgi:hypothetical protein
LQKQRLLFLLGFLACLPYPGLPEPLDIGTLNIQGRSVALSESLVAGDDYLSSRNPAALGAYVGTTVCAAGNSTAAGVSLALSQARLAYDRYGYQIQGIVPFPAGALGIRFDQLIIQNQAYYRLLFNPDGTPIIDPITNQQAAQLTYDTQIESLVSLAYGLEIIPGIVAGLEGQVIHAEVGEDYAWGFDGSAGVDARLSKEINLGVCIRQVNGGWVAWRNPFGASSGRPEADLGATYRFEPCQTQVSAALVQNLDGHTLPQGKVGAEYTGFLPLTLRAGWDADHATVGAGFVWKAITVDYAAIISGALYDANRITLKVEF